MIEITHEYLENLKNTAETINVANDIYDDFDTVWSDVFLGAQEILIELRYQKAEEYMNEGKYTYNYRIAGDEGEDWIYIRKDDKWHKVIPQLSFSTSLRRIFCYNLFYEGYGDVIPKIKEVDDKLTTVLHDESEKKVFGVFKGYDIATILQKEQEVLGHGISSWKVTSMISPNPKAKEGIKWSL